jgi:glycine cleavage system aminomethyltransferase T
MVVVSLPNGQGSQAQRTGPTASGGYTVLGVSVFVSPGGPSYELDDVLRRAGAVFSGRVGRPVAVNYGSACGELAVCVSGVGLVDRSGLSKLEIEAPAAQLGLLIERFLDGVLAPGGALSVGATWWCRAAPNRILAISEPAVGQRLGERVRVQAMHQVPVVVRDRSAELAALELLGRDAHQVLRRLGVFGESGDPRGVHPFSPGTVEGIDVLWLLESDRRALALVAHERAGDLWRALEQAGHEFGISCVGRDAATRYALLERFRRARLLGD